MEAHCGHVLSVYFWLLKRTRSEHKVLIFLWITRRFPSAAGVTPLAVSTNWAYLSAWLFITSWASSTIHNTALLLTTALFAAAILATALLAATFFFAAAISTAPRFSLCFFWLPGLLWFQSVKFSWNLEIVVGCKVLLRHSRHFFWVFFIQTAHTLHIRVELVRVLNLKLDHLKVCSTLHIGFIHLAQHILVVVGLRYLGVR